MVSYTIDQQNPLTVPYESPLYWKTSFLQDILIFGKTPPYSAFWQRGIPRPLRHVVTLIFSFARLKGKPYPTNGNTLGKSLKKFQPILKCCFGVKLFI